MTQVIQNIEPDNELATESEKWNGKRKPRQECADGRHPPWITLVGVLPWTCRSDGKWPSRSTSRQSNSHKWLASRKVWNVEELETLPAGTKPRTSRTPSIAWRREAWKEETLDDLPWKDKRGSLSIRRTLELFQRRFLEKFPRYGLFRAHRYHLELSWTEPDKSHTNVTRAMSGTWSANWWLWVLSCTEPRKVWKLQDCQTALCVQIAGLPNCSLALRAYPWKRYF